MAMNQNVSTKDQRAKIKATSQTLDAQNRAKGRAAMLVGVSIVVFIILLGLMLFGVVIAPLLLWLIFMAIMVALLAGLGLVVNGRGLGILIDARNRISLSRLQITLWSILVLPAFLAIALPRSLPGGTDQPLNIALPAELVTALGISTASLAGSSLVKSNKSTKESRVVIQLQDQVAQARAEVAAKAQQMNLLTTDAAATWPTLKAQSADAEMVKQSLKGQVVQARADLGQAEQKLQAKEQSLRQFAEMPREGLIKTNRTVADASLMDLFMGDEIGNYDRVDLSKVQMLLLTVVILVAYSAALYDLLLNEAVVFDPAGVSLPLFSASISTLLAISHGGYLAVKAVDHSKAA
jgi:hypothetical protein